MEEEERRDAVAQLGAMKHPDASRVAVGALKDLVRQRQGHCGLFDPGLAGEESAGNLIPLLADKMSLSGGK